MSKNIVFALFCTAVLAACGEEDAEVQEVVDTSDAAWEEVGALNWNTSNWDDNTWH